MLRLEMRDGRASLFGHHAPAAAPQAGRVKIDGQLPSVRGIVADRDEQ
ncbi:hypothetical protein [Actinomadura soli]|nr:hypothetical protein [Actinomadura soli]